MKNVFLLFIFLTIFFSCEDPQDVSPPSLIIISHISNQIVSGISTITVITEDNESVERVEFRINNAIGGTDFESPYEYEWNTESYENLSSHSLQVTSYDQAGNFTQSDTLFLIVDNRVTIWGQFFDINDTDVLDLESFRINSGALLPTSIPSEIGDLINLQFLNLSLNKLNDTIPNELFNLLLLEELYLNQNYLSGPISKNIEQLQQLHTLSIIDNEISGNIPAEIGSLNNLKKIFLYNNQLTGGIPEEIGYLTNLTELRLQNNLLEGVIPESICNLDVEIFYNVLGATNFSNNKLCPPYPTCIEGFIGLQDTSDCNEY